MAFKRFFNAEEPRAAKIDWSTAKILEKIDGSMCNVAYDWIKNEWYVSTSGMLEAGGECNDSGMTFAELFWKAVGITTGDAEHFKSCLIKGFTYVFELATPVNIVVVPHTTYSVTLLTIRNVETLEELKYEWVAKTAGLLKVPHVKQFDLNIKDVIELKKTFEGMPFSEEGYVICDNGFNRLKVKNPAYLIAHRLKSKTSAYGIMDVIKSNEIDEYIATFAERKDEILSLKAKYDNLLTTLEATWIELQTFKPKNITAPEKKNWAAAVFEICEKNDVKPFTGIMFGKQSGKIGDIKDYMFEFDNKKLYEILNK
jgi:hypothetical protein